MDDLELTPDVIEADASVGELTPEVRERKKPGPPKGKGGRPKGRPNNVTLQIREAATKLVSDPLYWKRLRADLRKRKVHPQVETTLLAYAFGKPVERVEVGRAGDFSKMSDAELVERLDATLAELRPVPALSRVRRA